jgi:hypothetical protein
LLASYRLTAHMGSGIIAAQNEILGRGQVARHRVLVPGSQVRILPPQPVGEAIRRSP